MVSLCVRLLPHDGDGNGMKQTATEAAPGAGDATDALPVAAGVRLRDVAGAAPDGRVRVCVRGAAAEAAEMMVQEEEEECVECDRVVPSLCALGDTLCVELCAGYNVALWIYRHAGAGAGDGVLQGGDGEMLLADAVCAEIVRRRGRRLRVSVLQVVERGEEEQQPELRDLLLEGVHSGRGTRQQALRLREHPLRGVCVQNATELPVTGEEDMRDVLRRARSRSGRNTERGDVAHVHTILTLFVTRPGEGSEERRDSEIENRLTVIELAPYVRKCASRRSSVGLDAVACVVAALTEQPRRGDRSGTKKKRGRRAATSPVPAQVPYSASLLTTLLKACFGGSTKTTVLAQLRSGPQHVAEALVTMRAMSRMKTIPCLVQSSAGAVEDAYRRLRADMDSLSTAIMTHHPHLAHLPPLFQAVIDRCHVTNSLADLALDNDPLLLVAEAISLVRRHRHDRRSPVARTDWTVSSLSTGQQLAESKLLLAVQCATHANPSPQTLLAEATARELQKTQARNAELQHRLNVMRRSAATAAARKIAQEQSQEPVQKQDLADPTANNSTKPTMHTVVVDQLAEDLADAKGALSEAEREVASLRKQLRRTRNERDEAQAELQSQHLALTLSSAGGGALGRPTKSEEVLLGGSGEEEAASTPSATASPVLEIIRQASSRRRGGGWPARGEAEGAEPASPQGGSPINAAPSPIHRSRRLRRSISSFFGSVGGSGGRDGTYATTVERAAPLSAQDAKQLQALWEHEHAERLALQKKHTDLEHRHAEALESMARLMVFSDFRPGPY